MKKGRLMQVVFSPLYAGRGMLFLMPWSMNTAVADLGGVILSAATLALALWHLGWTLYDLAFSPRPLAVGRRLK